MDLSDRLFVCQNADCAYHHVPQDRDHNASLNILDEALRLIGLMDQAVGGTGSDEDAKLAVDLMEDQKSFGFEAIEDEAATTKGVGLCLHTFYYINWSRYIGPGSLTHTDPSFHLKYKYVYL
ncbi:hypothetical protein KDK_68660 [Dictyobacter kobayashii]|uniref:Uncharacterized protein n=1 Tax=Dictyobacter kobayashii TaxID=2014872 RepID=A0A402AVC4_9CHLR|nr:hypothetical protein KDK_68660 [Dictyobacter kobayashii]